MTTESSRTPPEEPESPAPEAADGADRNDQEPPVFQHPSWMLGVVLVFGVVAIVAGLGNPIWFIIGFPCILVLIVWLWVRWRTGAL